MATKSLRSLHSIIQEWWTCRTYRHRVGLNQMSTLINWDGRGLFVKVSICLRVLRYGTRNRMFDGNQVLPSYERSLTVRYFPY